MTKTTPSNYHIILIALHWLSVLTVWGLFGLGFWMVGLDYYSGWYTAAPMLHISIGLVVLVLSVYRLWVRYQYPRPASHNIGVQKILEQWGHLSLYFLLFVVLFSGYLISSADGRDINFFNLVAIPTIISGINNQESLMGDIHEWSSYILMILSIGHGMMALWHHFIIKDTVLIQIIRR